MILEVFSNLNDSMTLRSLCTLTLYPVCTCVARTKCHLLVRFVHVSVGFVLATGVRPGCGCPWPVVSATGGSGVSVPPTEVSRGL